MLSRRAGLRLLGGAALATLLARRPASRPFRGPRRIALLQYIDAPPLNGSRDGFIAALRSAGLGPAQGIELLSREGGGSQRRTQQLAAELVGTRPDLLVAIGTPSLVALLAAAPVTMPLVFCCCSNPWGAGAGRSPTQHRPNVTGTITTNPVAQQLQLARSLLPGLARVGLLYNPAEPNASFAAELLAQAAAAQQVLLLREAVDQRSELRAGFQRLQGQGMQVLLQIGDYITRQGVAELAALALQARLPLIGVDPDYAALPGCLAVVGWDPRVDGRHAGAMAVQILRGTSPAGLAFEQPGEPGLWLNRGTAAHLGIALPKAVVARATAVLA